MVKHSKEEKSGMKSKAVIFLHFLSRQEKYSSLKLYAQKVIVPRF